MITIHVNGKLREVDASSTVADLLASLKIANRYCAVERNLHVVPREEHADCQLQHGDRLEVVTLVGGG